MAPNLLMQKLPGPKFTLTVKMHANHLRKNERAGLIVFGLDYAMLDVSSTTTGLVVKYIICKDAHKCYAESVLHKTPLITNTVYLRMNFRDGT